jgi:hypothetical protein
MTGASIVAIDHELDPPSYPDGRSRHTAFVRDAAAASKTVTALVAASPGKTRKAVRIDSISAGE